jgi:voltage-gated potassium channel
MINIYAAIGLGGVGHGESQAAHAWERRLGAPMLGLSLFAAITFYLQVVARDPFFLRYADEIDLGLLVAFGGELVLMLSVVEHRAAWLRRNWLSAFVVVLLAASLMLPVHGAAAGVLRMLRLSLLGMALARLVHNTRGLSARSTPMLLMWAMLTVAAFGLGLFWIDPAVHSAGDGLWLAFVSAATVGYGDIVPSTTAGRLFAVATILVGNGALSLITASITTVFLNREERERQREMHRELLAMRHQQVEMHRLMQEILAERRHVHADGPPMQTPADVAAPSPAPLHAQPPAGPAGS